MAAGVLSDLNLSGNLFIDGDEKLESKVSGKTRLAAPQSETARAL